jgi:hypothetical protein
VTMPVTIGSGLSFCGRALTEDEFDLICRMLAPSPRLERRQPGQPSAPLQFQWKHVTLTPFQAAVGTPLLKQFAESSASSVTVRFVNSRVAAG